MIKMLDIFLHEYRHENRSAEVWLDENGVFVTRHFENKMWIKDIVHYGHNEHDGCIYDNTTSAFCGF